MNNPILTPDEKQEIDEISTHVSAVGPRGFTIDRDGVIWHDGNRCAFQSDEDYKNCKIWIEQQRWKN